MASVYSAAGFLQFAIVFGNPDANLATVRGMLDTLAPDAGAVIVLPELWASGFDYAHGAELAARTPELLGHLAGLAAAHAVTIGGSLIERACLPDGSVSLYNTFYLVGGGGVIDCYRKQHLFSLWGEDRFFATGGRAGPLQTAGGPVGALVCYDLRFPELAREQAFFGANPLLVAAQWPKIRLEHWRTLLRARAIENQLFIAAANGCGTSGDHELGGHSMIVGPDGRILAEAGDGEDARIVVLAEEDLLLARSRFQAVAERPFPAEDSRKIVTLALLKDILQPIRAQGGRVAFTNGCFDILHSGHADYLEKARKTADCLIVGLNSDASVRRLKGEERPVNREADRARVLAALGCVDFVVIFAEDTPRDLITAILPDVLVKGADWPEDKIVGAAEVKQAGGRIVRVAFAHEQSTSKIIGTIRDLPCCK
jgi:D-glycero-beta-D-manno-heptose 1-phosphate adenylyltransferase